MVLVIALQRLELKTEKLRTNRTRHNKYNQSNAEAGTCYPAHCSMITGTARAGTCDPLPLDIALDIAWQRERERERKRERERERERDNDIHVRESKRDECAA